MGLFDWLFGQPKKTTPTLEEDSRPEYEEQAYESSDLSPTEVKKKLDDASPIILVDVREPQEIEICSIDGAKHIPMGEIHERYKEISDNPEAEIIVFCHHGGRSMQVMHQLWGLGYQNCKNMAGGIHAWSLDVDPGVPRY